ncbi:hypothetical protein HKD37_04G009934 [Glycine soja]
MIHKLRILFTLSHTTREMILLIRRTNPRFDSSFPRGISIFQVLLMVQVARCRNRDVELATAIIIIILIISAPKRISSPSSSSTAVTPLKHALRNHMLMMTLYMCTHQIMRIKRGHGG